MYYYNHTARPSNRTWGNNPWRNREKVRTKRCLLIFLVPTTRLASTSNSLARSSPSWEAQKRGDGTRYPCIDDQNVYSGCLGQACEATTCWAGRLVPSAVNATSEAPLPIFERKGCTCHTCSQIVERSEESLDCERGNFDRPITPACLVRKRVLDSVDVPCPDYQRTDALRPEVVEYRRIKREAERRSRLRGPMRDQKARKTA